MFVIRRMDAVLEPTKQEVLDTRKMLDEAGITEQRAALCGAAGQAFYNTSRFTLRDLKSRGSQQQLLADFEDYLNGFSPDVQDILENLTVRHAFYRHRSDCKTHHRRYCPQSSRRSRIPERKSQHPPHGSTGPRPGPQQGHTGINQRLYAVLQAIRRE